MPSLDEQPKCALREDSTGALMRKDRMVLETTPSFRRCPSSVLGFSMFIHHPAALHPNLSIQKWLCSGHLVGRAGGMPFMFWGPCLVSSMGRCTENVFQMNGYMNKGRVLHTPPPASQGTPESIHSVFSRSPQEAEAADTAELLIWQKDTPRGCGCKNIDVPLFTGMKSLFTYCLIQNPRPRMTLEVGSSIYSHNRWRNRVNIDEAFCSRTKLGLESHFPASS